MVCYPPSSMIALSSALASSNLRKNSMYSVNVISLFISAFVLPRLLILG
jgi:hypothetical protein